MCSPERGGPRRARETCSTPPPLLLRPRNLPWPPLSFPGRTISTFALASRFLHLFNADPLVTVSSTNTRPLTSRVPRKLKNLGDRLRARSSTILSFRWNSTRSGRAHRLCVISFPQCLSSCFSTGSLAEVWVTKGENFHERRDIKGRGQFGVRIHPEAKVSVVLEESKTAAEFEEQLQNMGPMWA
jgi:hypothetical protein